MIFDAEAAGLGRDLAQEGVEVLEILGADGGGVHLDHRLALLQIVELVELLERKGRLLLGQDLEQPHFLMAVAQQLQGAQQGGQLEEAVGDQHDGPARGELGDQLLQHRGQAGVGAGRALGQLVEDAPELRGGVGGRQAGLHGVGGGDEAAQVLVAQEEPGQRGGEVAGVVELRERRAVFHRGQAAGVGHAAGGVEEHGGAQAGLL